jgi:RNA polymerase sigma factor (TIGR02999 family)
VASSKQAHQTAAADSVDRLLPQVYAGLRDLASRFLGGERCDHTLQPTALVHEAYLRLIGQRSNGWRDRAEFFAVAATVMRRVLVDHARAKKAVKRGADRTRAPLDDVLAAFEQRAGDLVSLDNALDRLRALDQRKATLVELRFFGGLEMSEIAEVLAVPLRTLEREWALTKSWLRVQLLREGESKAE